MAKASSEPKKEETKKVETKTVETKTASPASTKVDESKTTVVPHSTGQDLVTEHTEGGGTKQYLKEDEEG